MDCPDDEGLKLKLALILINGIMKVEAKDKQSGNTQDITTTNLC